MYVQSISICCVSSHIRLWDRLSVMHTKQVSYENWIIESTGCPKLVSVIPLRLTLNIHRTQGGSANQSEGSSEEAKLACPIPSLERALGGTQCRLFRNQIAELGLKRRCNYNYIVSLKTICTSAFRNAIRNRMDFVAVSWQTHLRIITPSEDNLLRFIISEK